MLTPGGNSNLATTVTYTNSWAVTSVTGPNGANGTTTYDDFGRPQKTKIPDGAETDYTYAYVGLERGGGEPADGDVGDGDDGALEADDAGRVRAGDAGGERQRADDECGGIAGGYAVRAVRVLAIGEGVAGVDAVRAGRDGGVDDVHV